MGAVAWGQWPVARFPSPLIEPDVRGYRIRLSELAELGDLARFRSPRELVAISVLYPQKARPVTRSSAAASPRPVMGGREAFL